jgi:hypothetical protein
VGRLANGVEEIIRIGFSRISLEPEFEEFVECQNYERQRNYVNLLIPLVLVKTSL